MAKPNIVFLPIWGKLNETIPQQQMKAVRENGGQAQYGVPGTFFPLTRSAMKFRPTVISLDWIHQYALAPGFIQSLLKTILFALDVLVVKLMFRPKLVWTIHNLQHHDPRPRGIERWISSFFASQCTRVRILGSGVEQTVANYLKIPVSKCTVLPEGPYIGWYPEGQSRDSARKELNINTNDRVWLYLGTLRPYKGVEDLMDAFLRTEPTGHQLIIAGNPWNKAYAGSLFEKAHGHDNIRIHAESVPDNKLQTFFAAADLVVLPFRHVLNSGSVLLAMGFGKAVVAPEIGLIPFRLRSQPQFLFNDQNNLQAILEKTEELSLEELKEIGLENRRQALLYTWNDFALFVLNLK
jgi:glycosyltransferase involved in cell wall biosynthesis